MPNSTEILHLRSLQRVVLCATISAHTCPRVRLSCLWRACRMMALPQSLEEFAGSPTGGQMDVLSEVLKVVKLQGAMFYNGEFSSPWSVQATSARAMANFVAPGAEHVIMYHLLTEGRASVRMGNGEHITLTAGDIVMIPHGDPHIRE